MVIRLTALIRDKKKEQYSLRYCESGSRPACHHGRSVFFYLRDLFVITRAAYKIMMWCCVVPYRTIRYWHAPNKLVTGTDLYVGYCIPHTDKYHANKHIVSFFAFSVKALVIKIIRRKRFNQLPCTFLCTNY